MLYCILLTLCSWQQRVGYTIEVNLDVDNKKLSGIEYFSYYNNAPIALETIYLHIYPNAYKDTHTAFSRETERLPGANFRDAGLKTRSWINVNRVSIDAREIRFSVDTTILAVILDQPLNPDDSLKLVIDFELKIPKIFSRLGYHGDHYEFVQWYPKACVFYQKGGHFDTYHAIGEFYGEFGAYDVTINLPGDYIMAPTGKQIPTRDHEKTDLYNNRKSVRFQADNIHDFAWVCDPDFIMEKINVDNIEVKIYFQKKHRRKWRNAGVYAIGAVSRLNRWFGKYPFHDLRI